MRLRTSQLNADISVAATAKAGPETSSRHKICDNSSGEHSPLFRRAICSISTELNQPMETTAKAIVERPITRIDHGPFGFGGSLTFPDGWLCQGIATKPKLNL